MGHGPAGPGSTRVVFAVGLREWTAPGFLALLCATVGDRSVVSTGTGSAGSASGSVRVGLAGADHRELVWSTPPRSYDDLVRDMTES